jgi:putative two-component system response regulator
MKKPTILIVDDVEINREMLCEIFHECDTLQAANGREAIDIIAANPDQISVMLLDVVMPDMDGMAVLEEMKKRKWIDHLPVLLITGESTTQIERKAYQMGVADIIRKPFDAFIVKQRTKTIIELYYNKVHLEKMVELQTKVLRKQADELQSMNERIIDTMGNIVEFRNLESGDHVKRVKTFTNILAQYVAKNYPEYKLDAHTISVITSAAALHDVGKIAISDAILLKPGRLTKDEFEIMKSHTTRYDGNGYPDGLKGEDIPISAQIVSVADVYDALVSERCYKSAYTTEEAYNMIIKGECGVFSPKLMNCFALARAEFEAVAKSNRRMQEAKHA